MTRRSVRFFAALWACSAVCGCSLIADLGRFEDQCGNGDTSVRRNLQVVLTGFSRDYEDKRIELRVVDARDPVTTTLVAKAVIDGLDYDDDTDLGSFSFRMPGALPPGPAYRMHLFVDVDENGEFDGATDVGWDEAICSSGLFAFAETDITLDVGEIAPASPAGDFDYLLRDMVPHVSTSNPQQLLLMVRDDAASRVVLYYRLRSIDAKDFGIFVPEAITPNGTYTIQFFADVDRNGSFSLPPDHSWIETYEAGSEGLQIAFDHNTDFKQLDLFL